MTQRDESSCFNPDERYDWPCILHEKGSLLGEQSRDIWHAEALGILELCDYGVDDETVGEPHPCGHAHAGPGFFHLTPGNTIEDYLEATQ